MTMNEGFFGQYSVFCVFGSVVGCVVVPLIAQVLQQQSMECVILSAIVISLTAAHLNKKGGNDPSYSKILIPKELERKKINHNNNNSSNRKQKNQCQQQQHLQNAHQIQSEHDYLQQHEHLKNIEMERRSEEKRLKKLRKREERLKKREEESKKQKELEEHYRSLKEKRLKVQKENYCKTNRKYLESAVHNLDKFCGTSSEDKRCGLAPVDQNRVVASKPHRTLTNNASNNSNHYQQKIPRFERNRTGSCTSDSVKSSNDEHISPQAPSNNLSIKCSLSASCSSLSSISSSDSASPPMPVSPPCIKTPWVTTAAKHTDSLSFSSLPVSTTQPKLYNDGVVTRSHNVERSLKSYSNTRVTKSRPKLIPDNSSLFCSQLDGLNGKETGTESQPIVGEYSLFGPQRFATSFARSPVM